MAERAKQSEGGFTIAEMLVALAILVFGLTALAGSMTMGIGTRRGSEMRFRAATMVDHVVQDLRENYITPLDKEQPTPMSDAVDRTVPGFPELRYAVRFTADPQDPAVVLARIQVMWKEQGEAVVEEFERIVVREVPLARRVAELKSQNGGNPR